MTAKRDYYEVLGVDKDADANAIKRAYRSKAMQYHPDRNPDDAAAEELFKEASEAYGVLIDDEKRQTYDRFGHDGLNGQAVSGFSGGFEDIFSHFGDILGDIFGGRGGQFGGRPRRRRGADLRVELTVSFEEAFTGTKQDVTFDRHDVCGACSGSGAKPGTRPEHCGACNGSGRVARQQGFFMVQTTCPVCRGAGTVIQERCEDCAGEGVHRVQRTLSVKIPAGIDDGMRLRVGGEGETGGPGGERGDLHIYVRVEPHEEFQRDGEHVHLAREISFTQAALGADIEVDTLHGRQPVSIPPGTQSGTVVRLRNRGFPRIQGIGHGDHFVTLSVAIPEDLSSEQTQALKRLRELGL